MNIVIKLPNKLEERILSFPFLQTLHQYCQQKLDEEENLNIHLLSSAENIDTLHLLPFNAYYHELAVDDLDSIFTIHRSLVDVRIDQPDLFISTTESFADASIGKQLGIPRRAGFGLGKNRFFLTDKISPVETEHFSDRLFPLIKAVEPYPTQMKNAYCRQLKPPYGDWQENPYGLIDLASPEGRLEHEQWLEFFDLAVNKNFVLMCSGLDEFDQEDQLRDFIKTLPKKNTYKTYIYVSNIEFARVVSHSRSFITWNRALSLLASYSGSSNVLLGKKNQQVNFGPKYFRGETEFVEMSSQSADQYSRAFDMLFRALD